MAWNPWRLLVCKPVRRRREGPARGNKKNLIRFCPVGARCEACPLKKVRLDYEARDSPEGEPGIMVFLANVGVKDKSKDSSVAASSDPPPFYRALSVFQKDRFAASLVVNISRGRIFASC